MKISLMIILLMIFMNIRHYSPNVFKLHTFKLQIILKM